ncbi:hypothetical protein [Rufibacter latericius]|uniref:hypothetical protein n=1 Tax=Rufibacter latericius TaxID=2487040 RepID=UPI000F62AF36|nr:hypothetical protein [Rufibacter latericius]
MPLEVGPDPSSRNESCSGMDMPSLKEVKTCSGAMTLLVKGIGKKKDRTLPIFVFIKKASGAGFCEIGNKGVSLRYG